MEAVIASVGEKADELAFDLIKREITCILNYKTNVENLRDGVDDLKHARQRVQRSVDAAKRKGEEIYSDVEKWLSMVDDKIHQVAAAIKLEEEQETTKERYHLIRISPNFMSRYQLSKKAEKEVEAIAELVGKGRFESVSHPRFRPVKGYYKGIDSRTNALDRVLEALRNDNSYIVGVYGMGGLGMTNLVKKVAALAKEEQLFDEVIMGMAAVTRTPNVERIRDQIAQNLGLKIDEASLDGRKVLMCDRLKKTDCL
ncbi:NB-ARC domain-containing protein [Corchorus olitorius]|uniref:NB-ARC domain-containing protein n=1 Tax=Corchorus olitorius TaxID=93759 RepID=A0A1R3HE91_9ROSI|nr:NB-ARC domain-containing protein [Corchorus olitorius]